jgi:putative proteasome-type protease
MTFCLGIAVEEGLVGLADTRVLSGSECLVARKTASYQGPGFSFFVMNSGLRSLRDKILLYFEEAFARGPQVRDRLYKVVNLYAQQVRRVAEEDRAALERADLNLNSCALIGGQMAGDSAHRLFLVYPEGNWVEIGPDTPYQIIGASGFGKPVLERTVTRSDSMLYAFKVGLLAFDATRLCASNVDFPVDVVLYARGSFSLVEQRYDRDDLREITTWWQERMRNSVHDLPSEWIEAAFQRLTRAEVCESP